MTVQIVPAYEESSDEEQELAEVNSNIQCKPHLAMWTARQYVLAEITRIPISYVCENQYAS